MSISSWLYGIIKDFFFESVVTVNLTAMLVLTTMFISTSTSLPTTSFIKMVDIWLIFNLFLFFFVVLLHTYMDTLREEEDREVNHHGKAIDVGTDNAIDKTKINNWIVKIGSKDLVPTNEELQQRAIRNTIQFATFF